MPPPGGDSEDEFDALSDPFGEIDWNAIPGLADCSESTPPTSRARQQNATVTAPENPAPSAEVATPESAQEYEFDDVDASVLAELDMLEERMTTGPSVFRPSSSAPQLISSRTLSTTASRGAQSFTDNSRISPQAFYSSRRENHRRHSEHVHGNAPVGPNESSSPRRTRRGSRVVEGNVSIVVVDPQTPNGQGSAHKRLRQASLTPVAGSPSKKTKGKQRESPNAGLRKLLSDFEDELTCPICCDIFAAAHLGNPCGHTFCGDCGWQWISKSRKAPTCAICRSKLFVKVPMIPNFAMDNTIDKHIQALVSSGDDGWREGGSKLAEWQRRKDAWKAQAAVPESKAKTPVARALPVPVLVDSEDEYAADDALLAGLIEAQEAADDDYEGSDLDNGEEAEEGEEESSQTEQPSSPAPVSRHNRGRGAPIVDRGAGRGQRARRRSHRRGSRGGGGSERGGENYRGGRGGAGHRGNGGSRGRWRGRGG